MVIASRANVTYCRLTNSGGAAATGINLFSQQPSSIVGCQIIDYPTAIEIENVTSVDIVDNSARNCSTFLEMKDSTASATVVNNLAWGNNAAGSEFFLGTTTVASLLQNNGYGNFATANSNRGDWPEFNKITITGDPFNSASDLRLNDTAGAGAAVKGQGINGNDIGAIQATAAAAAGVYPAQIQTFGL